jgi:hypothetical protein
MTTGWDYASKIAEKNTGSGIYLKLDRDGAKVVGAFVGDPHVEEVVFNEATNRTETFTKQHAAEGKRPSARFSFNFLLIAQNGEKVTPSMKVYQCNARTFKSIVKVREKYGTDVWFFEIERKGDKHATDTTYMVLPEEKISDDIRAKIAKAIAMHEAGDTNPDAAFQLNTLGTRPSREDGAAPAPKAAPRSEEAPPSAKILEIRDRLKQRPRADIDKFLKHFGVEVVKDLRPNQVAEALDFLAALEKPESAPAADPFAD